MSPTDLTLGVHGWTSDIWSNTGPVRPDLVRRFCFYMPHCYCGLDLGCRDTQESAWSK